MPRAGKYGSTAKQRAYALRTWGAKGKDKQQIALDCGYSRHVAKTVKSKIENTRGYNNVIAKMAADSNNLALSVMATLRARGFEDFSNKDLVGALNAISGAWKIFNAPLLEKAERDTNGDGSANKLRTVILQRIENATINNPEQPKEVEPAVEDDF